MYDTAIIGLTMEREKLYERINQRVDLMIEEGLIEEVKVVYINKGLQGLSIDPGYRLQRNL